MYFQVENALSIKLKFSAENLNCFRKFGFSVMKIEMTAPQPTAFKALVVCALHLKAETREPQLGREKAGELKSHGVQPLITCLEAPCQFDFFPLGRKSD